jgi:hypothetical protein
VLRTRVRAARCAPPAARRARPRRRRWRQRLRGVGYFRLLSIGVGSLRFTFGRSHTQTFCYFRLLSVTVGYAPAPVPSAAAADDFDGDARTHVKFWLLLNCFGYSFGYFRLLSVTVGYAPAPSAAAGDSDGDEDVAAGYFQFRFRSLLQASSFGYFQFRLLSVPHLRRRRRPATLMATRASPPATFSFGYVLSRRQISVTFSVGYFRFRTCAGAVGRRL